MSVINVDIWLVSVDISYLLNTVDLIPEMARFKLMVHAIDWAFRRKYLAGLVNWFLSSIITGRTASLAIRNPSFAGFCLSDRREMRVL